MPASTRTGRKRTLMNDTTMNTTIVSASQGDDATPATPNPTAATITPRVVDFWDHASG
jgi:hypothetical protein